MRTDSLTETTVDAKPDDEDTLLTWLRLSNQIWHVVYGMPVFELDVPEPLRFPHPRTPKGGR